MLFVNHLGCIITLLLACNMGFSWVMEYLHPYSFNLLFGAFARPVSGSLPDMKMLVFQYKKPPFMHIFKINSWRHRITRKHIIFLVTIIFHF